MLSPALAILLVFIRKITPKIIKEISMIFLKNRLDFNGDSIRVLSSRVRM